jgi:hypothetical protein
VKVSNIIYKDINVKIEPDHDRIYGLIQVIVACSRLDEKGLLHIDPMNPLWLPAVYEALYGKEKGKESYKARVETDRYFREKCGN